MQPNDILFGVRLALLLMSAAVFYACAGGVVRFISRQKELREANQLQAGLALIALGSLIANLVHLAGIIYPTEFVMSIAAMTIVPGLVIMITGYFFSITAWAIVRTEAKCASCVIWQAICALLAVAFGGSILSWGLS
jgi:hypothetical protein